MPSGRVKNSSEQIENLLYLKSFHFKPIYWVEIVKFFKHNRFFSFWSGGIYWFFGLAWQRTFYILLSSTHGTGI